MEKNELIKFLQREREIQNLLSKMDKEYFMRYAIDRDELNKFSQEVESPIFKEAYNRFLKKTECSETTNILSITPDNRRKMLARNFKDVDEVTKAVELADISPRDEVGKLFRDTLLNHSSVNFQEIEDIYLFQLYELTRMVIETIGFIDNFDEIIAEWSYRESIRRFSFLCPDDFVNRDIQISQISKFISGLRHESFKPIMFIEGVGGVGKTALLAKAILLQLKEYNSELLLPIYFDFEDKKYRGELGFYIFFEACQQIEALIQNGKERFAEKRKEWLERSRRRSQQILEGQNQRFDLLTLTKEFKSLLNYLPQEVETKNQRIIFIFDSLETHLQIDTFREKLSELIRHFNNVFERDTRFRYIAISRTRSKLLQVKPSWIINIDVSDLEKSWGIEFLSKKLKTASCSLLEQVFDMVGGNPLNLKITAELLEKYLNSTDNTEKIAPDYEELLSKELRQSFRSKLDSELIRERLFNRILDTFEDPHVRTLVHPGFILRSINKRIFEEILQPFLSEFFKDNLNFEDFKREVSCFQSIIFTNEQEQSLTLNPEIRKTAVELMLKDKPDECQNICSRAIKFFEDVERESKEHNEKLRAKAEQIYYHLLNGTAGSRINQIWEPDCLQYISFDDGLPDRGKAWLRTKDSSYAVVPLDWIEQSGIYEQNRLLSRATAYFFEKTELTKMQRYFNEMNESASVENCILAGDIALSKLNFEFVYKNTKEFLSKNQTISQRHLFAIKTREIKAYLMSGKYQDGVNYFKEFYQNQKPEEIEESNLLRREIIEFYVFLFALIALADSEQQGNNTEIKEKIKKFLESLFLEMPLKNFNRNNDLALQFIFFGKLQEPELYVHLLSSLEVESIAKDLKWLFERLLKTTISTDNTFSLASLISINSKELESAKQVCTQLAILDQRIWSKAISVATFNHFEQSSELASWFDKWFVSEAKKEQRKYGLVNNILYGKLDSPYQQFDLNMASSKSKGKVANLVVRLSRCSGILYRYVEEFEKKSSSDHNFIHLPQLFFSFYKNLEEFSSF